MIISGRVRELARGRPHMDGKVQKIAMPLAPVMEQDRKVFLLGVSWEDWNIIFI